MGAVTRNHISLSYEDVAERQAHSAEHIRVQRPDRRDPWPPCRLACVADTYIPRQDAPELLFPRPSGRVRDASCRAPSPWPSRGLPHPATCPSCQQQPFLSSFFFFSSGTKNTERASGGGQTVFGTWIGTEAQARGRVDAPCARLFPAPSQCVATGWCVGSGRSLRTHGEIRDWGAGWVGGKGIDDSALRLTAEFLCLLSLVLILVVLARLRLRLLGGSMSGAGGGLLAAPTTPRINPPSINGTCPLPPRVREEAGLGAGWWLAKSQRSSRVASPLVRDSDIADGNFRGKEGGRGDGRREGKKRRK